MFSFCSRVSFYIDTFKCVTKLETKFHREISLVRTRRHIVDLHETNGFLYTRHTPSPCYRFFTRLTLLFPLVTVFMLVETQDGGSQVILQPAPRGSSCTVHHFIQ